MIDLKNVLNHTLENKFEHGMIKKLSTSIFFAWKPSLKGKNFFRDDVVNVALHFAFRSHSVFLIPELPV